MTLHRIRLALFSKHIFSCKSHNCGRSAGWLLSSLFYQWEEGSSEVKWFTELLCDRAAALLDMVGEARGASVRHSVRRFYMNSFAHKDRPWLTINMWENSLEIIQKEKPIARGMISLGKRKYFLLLGQWNDLLPLFCCSVVLWHCSIRCC